MGVESHLIGEGGAFGLAFEAAQGDSGGVQFTGQRIDESGGASEELGLGEAGETGDAQGKPQAMWSPRARSISGAATGSPLLRRSRREAMISLASSLRKFLMKPSKRCSPARA